MAAPESADSVARPATAKTAGYRPGWRAAVVIALIVVGFFSAMALLGGTTEAAIIFFGAVVYTGLCCWVGSIARRYYGTDPVGWGLIALIATPPVALLALIAIAVGLGAGMAKRAQEPDDGEGV